MSYAAKDQPYFSGGPDLEVVYSLRANQWRVKQGRAIISRHATKIAAEQARDELLKGEKHARASD